jgi:excisionase family DNA binding protein
MADRLLTAQETADYLGIPLATLYQWRSRRQGPVGHRVGRHVRYRRRDVDAWLNGQRDEWQ